MILKEITVHKDATKKLTIKGKLGGYKSDEETGGITMTFTLEDGEHLQGETVLAQEANNKVREALRDLMDNDPDWIKEKSPAQIKYTSWQTRKPGRKYLNLRRSSKMKHSGNAGKE